MRNVILAAALLLTIDVVFAQDVLTPELLWKMDRVGGVKPSPDGTKVLFSVSSYKLEEDKGQTNLFVMNPDGSSKRQLIVDAKMSQGNGVWRPDGEKIGFMMDGNFHEVNPDGSGMTQVTSFEFPISNVSYAPDLKHLSFSVDVKVDKTLEEIYPDLPMADAKIIDDLMYRHWDHWNDESYSHVHISDYSDGKAQNPKDIMTGERWDTPIPPFGGADDIVWSPDGKKLIYVGKKMTGMEWAVSTNTDLYEYDLESGKTTNITKDNPGYDNHPVFSPDGKRLAWLSMARDGYESDQNVLKVRELSSGVTKSVTKDMDETVAGFNWSLDGRDLFFVTPVNATYQIFEVSVPKSLSKGEIEADQIRQISKGQHNMRSVAPVAGGGLVGIKQSMSMASEIYSLDRKSGADKLLTSRNKGIYDQIKLGKVEKRMIKATDGKDILTWVIYPPDFDPSKKYPALLYCQGGPQSAVSQFFSFRWNFQLMAAKGYIVVAPNRRGLPSFGTEWNEQISGDWGGQCMKDYLSAIDEVSKEEYVDENRLGAVGASFGGYSVYYLAGIHENRFKALISHCGLFNLESWYGTTEELFFANWDVGGPYWEEPQPKSYEMFSPHKLIKNWTAPLMVIHGGLDFRVPESQGFEAFQAAKIMGLPSRMLYYPNEGHWVLKPQNGVVWHREFFRWLDTYLK